VLPSHAFQKTEYVYGVSTGTGSDLNSNELLSAIRYPDKTTGAPNDSDKEVFRYNIQGEVKSMTQRRGTVHDYDFDVVGRQIRDKVTTLGGADSAVRRLETAYDTAGRPHKFTSYTLDSGGAIVNEVLRQFNGLGQLTAEYQAHAGAVDLGGSSTTPRVRYAYTEMSGGANHSRLVSMTYPDSIASPAGRVLTYNYTGLDNSISRLSSQSMSSTTLETYAYLGLDNVVVRGRPEPNMDLTYIKRLLEADGEAGDQYTGLDRFGRVVDQRWRRGTTSTHADRFKYGYDPNGNRLYRDNAFETTGTFDELYHPNGEAVGYDGLNQLTEFRRGLLSDSGSDGVPDTVTAAVRNQVWSLDAMGNWNNIKTNGTNQLRTHDKQNQLTSIQGLTTPVYDANGNTVGDETGKTLAYDAWNRLVSVTGSPGVTHAYDALGRRVKESRGASVTDLYYSSGWQALETRNSTTKTQFVWNPGYVDSMVLRDRDAGGDGVFEQRLYVQQDANFNVTSISDDTRTVVERYAYDPYGAVTYLDANWGALGTSAYGWVYLHQGGRYDSTGGLYHFRNRELSPTLGRWLQNDPLRHDAGDTNLYRAVENNPTNLTDPSGLVSCGPEVTDWFMKEIDLFRQEARTIRDGLEIYLQTSACGVLDNGAGLATFTWAYRRLALLADYKNRNRPGREKEPFDYGKCKDPDKNTVTLCGVCVGTNQLGNIMFGIIAAASGFIWDSREFGKACVKPSWLAPGEGFRQHAFEFGVDYERYEKNKSTDSFCKNLKGRQDNLAGPKWNDLTKACDKEPCKESHVGPNTDMKRKPLT
jgi:RHS repeat-associated protein